MPDVVAVAVVQVAQTSTAVAAASRRLAWPSSLFVVGKASSPADSTLAVVAVASDVTVAAADFTLRWPVVVVHGACLSGSVSFSPAPLNFHPPYSDVFPPPDACPTDDVSYMS